MTFLTAVFLYPLVLAVLSTGAGLTVERLAGWRLPTLVTPVVGFAALIAIGQMATTFTLTAPWTGPIFALFAGVGLTRQRNRIRSVFRAGRAEPWPWLPSASPI
jgi:hypothetical protein